MVESSRLFNMAYIRRVRELRESLGWTQEQMAKALDVPVERYKKYETRSPLPPYLIERFALIVRREISYILTGKGANRPRPTVPSPSERAAPPQRGAKRGVG